MGSTEHLSSAALLQDPDPEAILQVSCLPPCQIRSLLDTAPRHKELHGHIVQALEMLEYFGTQMEQMKTWKCEWEDLCKASAIAEIERRCDEIREKADRYDVEELKRTVLALHAHATDAEALLTALMFRLLTTLSGFELLLVTYENRADVSRLHLLIQDELSEINLHSCDDARARIAKAGSVLDHLIELSREPVPDSWIDDVERMEEKIASVSVPDPDHVTEGKLERDIEARDIENDADANMVAAAWETQRVRLYTEAEKTRVQELTRRQELEEEVMIARQIESDLLHKQEQAEMSVAAVSYNMDEEGLLSKGIDELELVYATPPHVISQPITPPPSSSISTESSAGGYNTDTTEDRAAHTRTSSVGTTAASPYSTGVGILSEKEPLVDTSDTRSALPQVGHTRGLTLPVGTLESTEVGVALDLNRVQQHSAERLSFSPLHYTGEHSPSQIPVTQELDFEPIDEECPLQQRKRLEYDVLAKDRYRGRNLLSSHAHSSSLGSAELDANDPKRLSVDVPSLRGTLATAKTSDESIPTSSQYTLDLKIRHILTTLPGIDLNIEPAEQPPAPTTNPSPYKLMTTTTSSSLKEAGYGQTQKYLLQRPNAPPQVIWVRIIAERVMVRVGGGWTDLAEWLSNYILYHASSGSPLNVVDPGTPNSKISPSPRWKGLPRDKESKKNTRQVTPSSTPGSGSKIPMPSPGRSFSGKSGKSNSSNSSSNISTPTPLGMAGPVSSLEKGKMSNEKRAWVHKMLRQVGVGEPKREDGDVSRQLFVGENK
ncbi:uncharacterized protein V1513DRAFT_113998 [Lipomyces chichibuensis]|uniref:uncharacterized protein n=1 Tax=Lipomyces chichibuensis TaxID=1546026 RepID=UPI0033432679